MDEEVERCRYCARVLSDADLDKRGHYCASDECRDSYEEAAHEDYLESYYGGSSGPSLNGQCAKGAMSK